MYIYKHIYMNKCDTYIHICYTQYGTVRYVQYVQIVRYVQYLWYVQIAWYVPSTWYLVCIHVHQYAAACIHMHSARIHLPPCASITLPNVHVEHILSHNYQKVKNTTIHQMRIGIGSENLSESIQCTKSPELHKTTSKRCSLNYSS